MHSKMNMFDKISAVSLFLVIVLLPLFCLPFTKIPIETSKGLLLVVGLSVCVIFWAIARFIEGKIIFPKSWLLLSGFSVVLIFLLSALLSGLSSGNSQMSLFGTMLDIGSFWFIFVSFILMLFCSFIFKTLRLAKIVLFGTIISSALVLFFQSVHLFFPEITSLGILTDEIANVLGSWNALGLFAGFAGLMFLLLIEFFPISKIEKLILAIFVLLSVLLIAAVNFPLVWILLGVSSLIILIYKISINFQINEGEEKRKHFPVISFVIVIVSLLFFLNPLMYVSNKTGDFKYLNNIIPNFLQISNTEVSPSFGTTMSVTKGVIAENPILGIGPNRFAEAWSIYKPISINNTQFWDVSFSSGSGFLPTLATTTGIFGILASLVFSVLYLIIGLRSVFSSIKNKANWEMMSFFVLSLYLFVSLLFYSGGMVIFLLAIAFAGVFIGLSSNVRSKEISVSFLNDHRKSFFAILFLVFIIIISATLLFKYIERFASVSYFRKAVSASEIVEAENSIDKALLLYSNDLYLRTYSQIHLLKFNSLANRDSNPLSDAEKIDLQNSLDKAVNGAQLAVTYNPKNYLNFQSLGAVYQNATLLGVKDAFSRAVEAYNIASTLNPNNPGLKLDLARVFFSAEKIVESKDYANSALLLKPNYVDAFIVLSQIAKSEGDNAGALSYAQKALFISPANTDLINYVNFLKNSSSTSKPITADQ